MPAPRPARPAVNPPERPAHRRCGCPQGIVAHARNTRLSRPHPPTQRQVADEMLVKVGREQLGRSRQEESLSASSAPADTAPSSGARTGQRHFVSPPFPVAGRTTPHATSITRHQRVGIPQGVYYFTRRHERPLAELVSVGGAHQRTRGPDCGAHLAGDEAASGYPSMSTAQEGATLQPGRRAAPRRADRWPGPPSSARDTGRHRPHHCRSRAR